ncbi:MAG TPA: DUF4192 domain-containing protein [Streptosporangiaceae bacterium]|nr:DUF4192 domain-containing protein [Streptosporangiaceae bacterium]
MNTQPQPQDEPTLQVRIRAADGLLAVVPYLLGFHPANSLVVLAVSRPGGRIRLVFRFDLPDPPDPGLTAEITGHAASLLTRNQCTDAVVIGYGPGILVTPLADRARQVLPAAGITLHDVLRVHEGRYWSYPCGDPSCCPPAGHPVPASTHPAAVTLAEAGNTAAVSRAALAATIAPLTGSDAVMTGATRQVEHDAVRLAATRPRALLTKGLAAVKGAITAYRGGGALTEPGEFAALAVALTSLRIRDDAWARMDPDHTAAHFRLWTDLVRRARPGYAAAPASLLAFTAWQAGDGALGNLALDRALADQPGYSMALLLRDALAACLPPQAARLPMTPEEVAASYDHLDPTY